MGQAKDSFERLKEKKQKEIQIYDIALKVGELIKDLSREDQRRVLNIVDNEMQITPPQNYSFYDR